MLITILFLVALVANCSQHPLQAINGRLEALNHHHCVVDANGIRVEGSGRLNGLHFGIIEYNCDNITGVIISKATCDDCGLYCASNELILECRQSGSLILMGFIIGLLPTIIICIVLRKVIWSIGSMLVDKFVLWRDNRADEIELKRIDKMNRRIDGDIVMRPSFKQHKSIKKSHINIINEKRDIASGYVKVSAPLVDDEYTTENKPDSINITSTENIYESANQPTTSKAPTRPYRAAAVTLAALAACSLTSIPNATACDNTLYVFSQGKVCDKTRCIESGVYQMALHSGSTVCFKDAESNVMTVRMGNSYYREKYMMQYKTSNYKLDVNIHSRCKADGGECWNDLCTINSKNKNLKYSDGTGHPNGYGCGVGTLGCDSWCWHKTSCTWYSWFIRPVGERIPVYLRVGRIWEIEVIMEYKGNTKSYVINTNNPKVDLDGLSYKIPIYITGFSAEDVVLDNGLILYSGNAYSVKASNRNMPERDIIGDYQISINEDEYTFNNDHVKCTPESCKANCVIPESKIARTISNLNTSEPIKYVYVNNAYTIEGRIPIPGTMNLMLGNVEFDSLYVDKAECNIDIPTTFSCVGCKVKPYAVVQAYDIKVPGLLNFVSNCSFETTYISCNPEPFKLTQVSDHKICMITMPTLNKSIVIDYNFTYFGSLTPSKFIMGRESIQDTIMSIGSSYEFWSSLTSTFAMSTMGIFCASVIIRIVKIYFIARTGTNTIVGTSGK